MPENPLPDEDLGQGKGAALPGRGRGIYFQGKRFLYYRLSQRQIQERGEKRLRIERQAGKEIIQGRLNCSFQRVFQHVLALLIMGWLGSGIMSAALVQDESSSKQFLVESNSDELNLALISFSTEARQKLQPLLGLSNEWKHRILIRIESGGDPRHAQPPSLSAIVRRKKLDFQITARIPPALSTEDFMRVLVTAFIYEKLIEQREEIKVDDTLPAVPLWLSEGVLQFLRNDATRNSFDRVVKRAAESGRAPGWNDINTWTELKSTTLDRIWQQAFSYFLVKGLTHETEDRNRFQSWLAETGKSSATEIQLPPAMADDAWWFRQIASAKAGYPEIVLTWEETERAIKVARQCQLTDPQTGKMDSFELSEIEKHRENTKLPELIHQKIVELTGLEARAHFAWRPVLAHYRQALMTFGSASRPGFEEWMKRAVDEEKWIKERNTAIDDYLNWFEVTHATSRSESAFSHYFNLQKEIENFDTRQADPFHSEIVKVEAGL